MGKSLSRADDLLIQVLTLPILLSHPFLLAEPLWLLSDVWTSNVYQDSHSLETLARKDGKSFKCDPEKIRPQTMDRNHSLSKTSETFDKDLSEIGPKEA